MEFSEVCRMCLSGEHLNQIFVNYDEHKRYSSAIYITTGIKVTPDDGLPQKMCTTCVEFVNQSLKYRKNCRDVESKLLETQNSSKEYSSTIKTADTDSNDEKEKDILSIEIKNKLSVKAEKKEIETTDIMMEYTDYEVLEDGGEDEDDDDKPLKYLMDTDVADENSLLVKSSELIKDMKSEEAKSPDPPYLPMPLPPGGVATKFARVKCKICQKELSIKSVNYHIARHHPGADPSKTKCDLCDSYLTKEKMARHMKMVHFTGKAMRCGYCKAEFDTKDVLIQHVTTCTAKKKKRKVCESGKEMVECDVCHKSMQRCSLRMHKAIKHGGLRPVCEHCGRSFGNKFRLNEHYRAKHGYDKFKCSYCDFQSAGSMAMRNHERKHRGEKPFVCETCGAKFHAPYLLGQHKQSHRTERSVKCDLCPATFKANNSLHMHKMSCHSRTLYKCHICDRVYSCRHYAVKHLRLFHRHNGPIGKLERVDMDGAS